MKEALRKGHTFVKHTAGWSQPHDRVVTSDLSSIFWSKPKVGGLASLQTAPLRTFP